jgi:hypothetical protein
MLRTIIAAWFGCVAFGVASAASSPIPARGCATYSGAGKLAAISIRDGRNLSLVVGDASTKASITLPFAATGCTAFFSEANDLVAVGLNVPLQESRDVNLLVLNPNSMEWVTPKPVSIRVAADSRGPLLGFVGATHTLLMMQAGEYSASADRTTVFVVQIDPFEHKATTSALAVSGKYVPGVSVVPNLAEDTLWLVQGDRGDCEVRAYHTDGSSRHATMPLSYSDCPRAELVVAAADGRLLKFENEHDTLTVRPLQAKATNVPAVRIGANGSDDHSWFSGQSAHSPDGAVLAISVKRVHGARWGSERISNEIVLLDTATLKVLSRLAFAQSPQEFAVMSSRDTSTLSWLEASGWTSRTVRKAGD